MKFKKRFQVEEGVPSSSMADIAFLLIIFFMVTTTFSRDKTQVDLPESLMRQEVPKTATIVTVKADGGVLVDGENVQMTDVLPLAMAQLSRNSEKVFIVKADRETRYQHVDMVMEQLRQAKAKNLSLLTTQELNK